MPKSVWCSTGPLSLKLYVNGGAGNNPINIHRATASWSESTVSFQSFDQQFAPDVEGVISPNSPNALKSTNLAGLVTQWLLLPLAAESLVAAVEHGFVQDAQQRRVWAQQQERASKLASLTPRELQVWEQVSRGRLNKQIGQTSRSARRWSRRSFSGPFIAAAAAARPIQPREAQ